MNPNRLMCKSQHPTTDDNIILLYLFLQKTLFSLLYITALAKVWQCTLTQLHVPSENLTATMPSFAKVLPPTMTHLK